MTRYPQKPLNEQEPLVLELPRLSAETILAHPEAVPADLYDLVDTWADELAGALDLPTPSEPGTAAGDTVSPAVVASREPRS